MSLKFSRRIKELTACPLLSRPAVLNIFFLIMFHYASKDNFNSYWLLPFRCSVIPLLLHFVKMVFFKESCWLLVAENSRNKRGTGGPSLGLAFWPEDATLVTLNMDRCRGEEATCGTTALSFMTAGFPLSNAPEHLPRSRIVREPRWNIVFILNACNFRKHHKNSWVQTFTILWILHSSFW